MAAYTLTNMSIRMVVYRQGQIIGMRLIKDWRNLELLYPHRSFRMAERLPSITVELSVFPAKWPSSVPLRFLGYGPRPFASSLSFRCFIR
jgi:hypothetical protein